MTRTHKISSSKVSWFKRSVARPGVLELGSRRRGLGGGYASPQNIARCVLGLVSVCLSQGHKGSVLSMQFNVSSRNQQKTEVDTVEWCKERLCLPEFFPVNF